MAIPGICPQSRIPTSPENRICKYGHDLDMTPEILPPIQTQDDQDTASSRAGQILSDATQEQGPKLQPESKSESYLSRHWRGELSLAQSFWINTLLVSLFMSVVQLSLEQINQAKWVTASPKIIAVLDLIVLVFRLLVPIWQIVGLWRSARTHFVKTQRVFWAGAVQIFVVLSALGLASYVATEALPLMDELGQVALGQKGFGGFTVRVILEGHEIEVQGDIGFGLTQEVRQQLDRNPEVRIIRLNSPGGRMAEAHMLRQLIESRNLNTYTSEGCFSACALIFMGGSRRILNPRARLGFHQCATAGGTCPLNVDEEQKAYLLSRGVNQEFVRKAFSKTNKDIWIPLPGELLLASVITQISTDTDDIEE